MILYSVRASSFPDADTRQRYLSWLCDGHAAAIVTEGGTLRAEVASLDDDAVEARYLFASREAFAAYQAGAAVHLRADAAAKFPDVSAARSLGEIQAVIT